MKIVKLKISGMTCDHCAKTIESKVATINGVINKNINYAKAQGEIEFDESLISENEIINSINETHYKVVGKIGDTATQFDIIIIGGGSAAFSAALTAESQGARVAIFNAGLPTGGTCVNVGCVPSKNLIRKAEAIHHAQNPRFEEIKTNAPEVDFKSLMQGKTQLVENLRQAKYIDVIKNKSNIQLISEFAQFKSTSTIIAGSKEYSAKKFIIATGSTTKIPPIKGIEKIDYLTHISLFELEELPPSLTILGAGYIGLEIAQTFRRFGSKVRIIEFTDRVIRTQTEDVSLEIQKHLQDEGIKFYPNYRITEFIPIAGATQLKGVNSTTNENFEFTEPGKVVIATGTVGNTQKLGLDNIGLKTDANDKIEVNTKQETNAVNIYAAGDCTNTPAFVYTAAAEGKTASLNALKNEDKETDYTALPWVVFTDPQVAGAGLDKEQAQAQGINAETAKIELKNVPKAIAANDMRGFIKLIRNTDNDELVGIRVVAPEGGELVMQAAIAIKNKMKVADLAQMLFPYLTLSEGVKLAAITFTKDVKELSCCAV